MAGNWGWKRLMELFLKIFLFFVQMRQFWKASREEKCKQAFCIIAGTKIFMWNEYGFRMTNDGEGEMIFQALSAWDWNLISALNQRKCEMFVRKFKKLFDVVLE